MIVGPGGALVNITGVTPGRLPGFYHVNVVPINTQTWKAECTFLPWPSSEVRTKGRLSLLFSWTEATSAALGAARGIWRLTYRCINQTGPCLPRRPGERSGLVHASNRKSSILGVNQSPYFVSVMPSRDSCGWCSLKEFAGRKTRRVLTSAGTPPETFLPADLPCPNILRKKPL